MTKLEPLPGTSDIWSPETLQWGFLEDKARRVMPLYGYTEVRTPIIERTEVFERGIGTDTEVVQKEMYTFQDRGGRSLTLRPEGTAGIMRAIAHRGMMSGEEKRVFYYGPMFRGERPAAGRKRQFHQIGAESVGKASPLIDVECMAMLAHYLKAIGLDDYQLLINSRGTCEDRQSAALTMQNFFRPQLEVLCDDCRRRIDHNVWRILDCKVDSCRKIIDGAPSILELFSEQSRNFFQRVRNGLDGIGIRYKIAPHLVRGLDYYQHTVFEVTSTSRNLGAQNAIGGGGRYEIVLPGSRNPIAGVGFAFGAERLLMALAEAENGSARPASIEVFVAALGPEALVPGLAFSEELRQCGLRVWSEHEGRSIKAQLRTADKLKAEVVVVIGEQELADRKVTIKHMNTRFQQTVAREQARELILSLLGS